jgi:hypothetical protein
LVIRKPLNTFVKLLTGHKVVFRGALMANALTSVAGKPLFTAVHEEPLLDDKNTPL